VSTCCSSARALPLLARMNAAHDQLTTRVVFFFFLLPSQVRAL
jgi:hypothetical protein